MYRACRVRRGVSRRPRSCSPNMRVAIGLTGVPLDQHAFETFERPHGSGCELAPFAGDARKRRNQCMRKSGLRQV